MDRSNSKLHCMRYRPFQFFCNQFVYFLPPLKLPTQPSKIRLLLKILVFFERWDGVGELKMIIIKLLLCHTILSSRYWGRLVTGQVMKSERQESCRCRLLTREQHGFLSQAVWVFISKEVEFIIEGGPVEEDVCVRGPSINNLPICAYIHYIHPLPLSFYTLFGPLQWLILAP